MSGIEELEAAALGLPRAERARLAERLITSLDEESEVEQAWAAEVRQRVAAIRSGEATFRPADEVFDEIRRELR